MSVFDMGKNTGEIIKGLSEPTWTTGPVDRPCCRTTRVEALKEVRAEFAKYSWGPFDPLSTIDRMIQKEEK